MLITVVKEGGTETRVAITPNVARQLVQMGFEVNIEQNAGRASGFSDEDYLQAGAHVTKVDKAILQKTDVLLAVNEPLKEELKGLRAEALIIAHIENLPQSPFLSWCLKHRISVFSMNYIPRISRAQNMDSLSSQANLAGYRAVISALNYYKRAVPMMMTAAGMIHPAKVLVLGAGVAGLQAIATAKRLGAVVYAFDVRQAAIEQVESLGAEFIEVPHLDSDNETDSGYARETSDEYRHLQAQKIDEYAQKADIIICTALIPNKKAPVLLKEKTVNKMKPGSVIVDLATAKGGNCEISELDVVLTHQGVTVIGFSNMAGLVPTTASELYANNVLNVIKSIANTNENLMINEEDEVIQSAMLCHDGQLLPFQFTKEALQ